MFSAHSAQAFAAATAPLLSNFGDRLTLWRDGNVVHWSYEGTTVVVAMEHDGMLDASYIDAPSLDHVTGTPVRAVYRRRVGRAYRLNSAGSQSMVADMMAFFSGDREPLFDFVSAQAVD